MRAMALLNLREWIAYAQKMLDRHYSLDDGERKQSLKARLDSELKDINLWVKENPSSNKVALRSNTLNQTS